MSLRAGSGAPGQGYDFSMDTSIGGLTPAHVEEDPCGYAPAASLTPRGLPGLSGPSTAGFTKYMTIANHRESMPTRPQQPPSSLLLTPPNNSSDQWSSSMMQQSAFTKYAGGMAALHAQREYISNLNPGPVRSERAESTRLQLNKTAQGFAMNASRPYGADEIESGMFLPASSPQAGDTSRARGLFHQTHSVFW